MSTHHSQQMQQLSAVKSERLEHVECTRVWNFQKTDKELYVNLNRPTGFCSGASGGGWRLLSEWLICGALCLLLNVPQVKGEMTIGSIVSPTKWPELLLCYFSQRWLAPFSSAGFHTDLPRTPHPPASQWAFTSAPLNSMPTSQKWMKAEFTCRLTTSWQDKFVRTMRLSVTSAIGHGNFVHFSGVSTCYCLIMPWRRRGFERPPQGFHSNRMLCEKSTRRLQLQRYSVIQSVSKPNSLG